MPTNTVAYYTLGCKLNFSETSTIARLFNDGGYNKVEFNDGADVYIINTCSVTDHADRKCKKVVAQALKHNPEAFIAVVGCYAQLKPEEIATIKGVDVVLGASEKFDVVNYIETKKRTETKIATTEIKLANTFVPAFSEGDRTRTFFKVQDGCDYFCAFCTIPLARGFSRSETIDATIAKAKELENRGIKEIVLTGVNIGDFGRHNDEQFFDLIKRFEADVNIERYRISSIEPNLLTEEIINFVAASKKFMPHFHIPLQSGSNKILKLMRRRYVRELYASRVALIKQKMPNACIGVDVIVGFPSETNDDFLDTYNFINELDVQYLHVFPYSERPNTSAARMKDVVTNRDRTERVKQLQILSEKKRHAFYQNQLNNTFNVLFEHEKSDGFMYGFTENYIKVKATYDPLLANEIVPYKITKLDNQDAAVTGYSMVDIPTKKELI